MLRLLRFALPIYCALYFLGCQAGEELPSEPRSLTGARGGCSNPQVATLIDALASTNKLRSELLSFCRNWEKATDIDEAEGAIFALLARLFELRDQGLLDSRQGSTVEDDIVELKNEAFAFIQSDNEPPISDDDIMNGDVKVKQVGPEGDDFGTPSLRYAIKLDPDVFNGNVWVTVTALSTPMVDGECPFSDPFQPFDCYAKQVDITISPEGLVDPVVLAAGGGVMGLCVADPPEPFSPPAGTQVRIAHEDDQGVVSFLPIATAPAALDCGGLATNSNGWHNQFWDALSPFRATPLYASPGKLGAAISSFSPFAPMNTEPRTGSISGTIFSVFDEISGAEVTLFDPAGSVIGFFVTGNDGMYAFDDVPIPSADITYTVEAFRNNNLSQRKTATLTVQDRDITLDFDLQPPGHQ